MKAWKIFGTDYVTRENLETLYIQAENFDVALDKARKINRCYDGGQCCEDSEQFVFNIL